jgi:hypothetical protein
LRRPLSNHFPHRLGVLLAVPAGDHDLGAGAGEALGDPKADAAVAAGDDRGLASEIEETHPFGST